MWKFLAIFFFFTLSSADDISDINAEIHAEIKRMCLKNADLATYNTVMSHFIPDPCKPYHDLIRQMPGELPPMGTDKNTQEVMEKYCPTMLKREKCINDQFKAALPCKGNDYTDPFEEDMHRQMTPLLNILKCTPELKSPRDFITANGYDCFLEKLFEVSECAFMMRRKERKNGVSKYTDLEDLIDTCLKTNRVECEQ